MQSRRVGNLELISLDDGSIPFPARYFFSNVPEPVWRAELPTDLEGKIAVGHNCGLLATGNELILMDTGYGDQSHDGRTGHLLEELGRAGYRPGQITMVVNSHAHGDHTNRNTVSSHGNREPAFPNATYFLGRADWNRFSGPDGPVHRFDQQLRSLFELGRLTLVDGPLQLTPEVSLLPTPGHTPGHISVLIQSMGKMAIFLGDLCHHPLHFAHPGWVSCFDTDPAVTPLTRAWLFRLALDKNALLVCPHATAPGFGRLVQAGAGLAWSPA
jgi:glyoxylase-like metal-dependent hydrolase (beta-lactamase superfamily II)